MSTKVDEPARVWASDRGRLACDEHLPAIGSAAWWVDRWRVMDEHTTAGFTRARGVPPACEACEALAERDSAS